MVTQTASTPCFKAAYLEGHKLRHCGEATISGGHISTSPCFAFDRVKF